MQEPEVASAAIAAISQFPVEDLSPFSLPPPLLTMLGVDLEQCDSELTLSGEQLVMAAVTSSAHAGGTTSLVQAVLERELPPPRGVVYTALQQAKSPTALERELQSTWSKLLKVVPQEEPLGLAAMAELICAGRSCGSRRGHSTQLQRTWDWALVSVEHTHLLSPQEVGGWRMLAGFSLPAVWSSFTSALLARKIEVRYQPYTTSSCVRDFLTGAGV